MLSKEHGINADAQTVKKDKTQVSNFESCLKSLSGIYELHRAYAYFIVS